jgi:hypothetical protein
MKVDVNKVREVVKWLQSIDMTDFSDIQWVDGDTEIEVSANFAEHFCDTGLSTTDFALLNFDKKKRE